jgi:hypothetical protein
MGKTFSTGLLTNGIWQDASNNIGIGAAPSGSYKLEVTGTAKVSSTLLVSGATTLSSTLSAGVTTINGNDSPLVIQATTVNKGIVIEYKNSAATRRGYIGYGADSSSLFEISNNENGDISFRANGSQKMLIGSGGKVGISNSVAADVLLNVVNGSSTGSGLNISAGSGSGTYALRVENYNGASSLLYVRGDGNVGIGESSPSYLLHLHKDQASTTTLLIQNTSDASGAAAELRFYGNTGTGSIKNGQQISFVRGSSGVDWALGQPADSNDFVIAGGTDQGDGKPSLTTAERMRITSGGYTKATNSGSYYSSAGGLFHEFDQSTSNQDTMWIYNTASSGYGLTINMPNTGSSGTNYFLRGSNGTSAYYLYSNGSSTFSSDRNLKKNIETTRNGYLEDIMNLRVVKYNWITQEDGEAKELGLIAQEVAEIFPSLVVDQSIPKTREIKQEDGSVVEEQYEVTQKGLKVSVLPFILLKAIQELNERLNKAGL